MADLFNEWPTWGETGELPADGFSYARGDRVNEKHFDGLWNTLRVQQEDTHDALRRRIHDFYGNVILGEGGTVTKDSGRTVTIDSLSAYVGGEHLFAYSTDYTLPANSGTTNNVYNVYYSRSGSLQATTDESGISDNDLILAEVTVDTSNEITDIQNVANHFSKVVSSETQPSMNDGDIWLNSENQRIFTQFGGSPKEIATVDTLNDHINDSSNPHSVTANQTGAYSQSQADFRFVARNNNYVLKHIDSGSESWSSQTLGTGEALRNVPQLPKGIGDTIDGETIEGIVVSNNMKFGSNDLFPSCDVLADDRLVVMALNIAGNQISSGSVQIDWEAYAVVNV